MAKKKGDAGERRPRTAPELTMQYVKEAIAANVKDGKAAAQWIEQHKGSVISYGTVLKYYKKLTGGGDAGEPTMTQLTRVREFAKAEFPGGLGEFKEFLGQFDKLLDQVGGRTNLDRCIRFWQSQETSA